MSRCATCDRKFYPGALKYAYHETDDGNHRIGGFITKLRRIDGALSHSCLQCYHQAFEDVCFLFAMVVDIISYSWILLNFTVRIDIFLLSNFPPWNLPENFNFDYFIPTAFLLILLEVQYKAQCLDRSFCCNSAKVRATSGTSLLIAVETTFWCCLKWMQRVQVSHHRT